MEGEKHCTLGADDAQGMSHFVRGIKTLGPATPIRDAPGWSAPGSPSAVQRGLSS